MKTQEFQALIEQLGDLSEVQRSALVAALKGNGSANDVIALIETRFAVAPVCGHCKSAAFGSWGVASGLRRYKCKCCSRTFNALTGTPLAQLHRREAWLEYARALVDGVSLRKAAERCGIHLETSFRWRHRFLASAKTAKAKAVTGIVEADETFIRKSAKGSKKITGRSPRKRGGTAKKKGLSTDDYDAVLIVRDRHGETTDALLPDLEGRTFAAVLRPVVAKDALLVSDGRAAYGQFADAANILHIAINASEGRHTFGTYHIQNVNAYTSRLKAWMARFKGVASTYLASYLGWRRMIERQGDRITPRNCFAGALA
jgi:transposase-like protein